MKEMDNLRSIMLRGTELGYVLSRNNVGAFKDATGRYVEFGCFQPGGSDLIGFKSTVIKTEHVGMWLPIFAGIEVKQEGWVQSHDKSKKAQREKEQLDRLAMFRKFGGIGILARSPDDLI